MCSSSHGLTTRSDPRFFFLPTKPALPTTITTLACTSDPFVCLPFTRITTHLPRPQGVIRTRFRSFRTKAAFNDGSVASFYELLGIPETGTPVEIKQAYKQLALKYHPDVSPADRVEEYTRRFILVQEAYKTLSDPRQRALYDRDMARGLHVAFPGRKRYESDEAVEVRSEWKSRWQAQLSELQRRSTNKEDAGGNMSWGARMRRQRND